MSKKAAQKVTLSRPDLVPVQVARTKDMGELKALLSNKQVAHIRDDRGKTALHWSAYSGNLAAMHLLLQQGADINATGKDGRNPLVMLMCQYRKKPSAKFEQAIMMLLSNGADVGQANESGPMSAVEIANDIEDFSTELKDAFAEAQARQMRAIEPTEITLLLSPKKVSQGAVLRNRMGRVNRTGNGNTASFSLQRIWSNHRKYMPLLSDCEEKEESTHTSACPSRTPKFPKKINAPNGQ